MISDPLMTVVQNISGTGLEAGDSMPYDMVGTGPGSQSSRKALSPIAGISCFLAIKHELTSAGRRRSVFRVDVKAPIGVTYFGDAAGVPHSASCYLTIDRLESDTTEEKLVVDHAVSGVLSAFVDSKASALAQFGPSATLLNFLNGEP